QQPARERRDPHRLPPGVRPARTHRDRARTDRHRAEAAAFAGGRAGVVADQGSLFRDPASAPPRRAGTVRYQLPAHAGGDVMASKKPRRTTWQDPAETPVLLPHVVVTVAENG